MSEYSIQVNHLQKKYGKKQAIRNLDLKLHKDQIIGLIGANGSGKTSFFKMCVGLEGITAGNIRILDGDPWKDMAVRSEMIYSMHDLPVLPTEKLKRILRCYEIAFPHFDQEFAMKMMDLFELPLKKSCKQLSQGMKSLFHFVCAIAARCQVTLLDEPFIGIDIEKRKMAYEILLRDYMEHPRTFVISSHNLAELEGVLSEMVLIHQGELVFYQDMDLVREMLCRVSGSSEAIRDFAERQSGGQIVHRDSGELGDALILQGAADSGLAQEARRAGLEVASVA
ncbi:MAG: ABC transporter ATP-binding protein, partial [Lachnospiraceae bacterium]|nr:ABC transporter ATP-binding protein [Lachnospiraceae bacterium]